jgi:hypothetical protein
MVKRRRTGAEMFRQINLSFAGHGKRRAALQLRSHRRDDIRVRMTMN